MNFYKHIFFIFFFVFGLLVAQNDNGHSAKGAFFTLGVGPRFPIGEFSRKNDIGPGFNAAISYTDIEFLPVFFYGKLGYQIYYGNYNYYKTSDFSTLNSSLFTADIGSKYFFKPIVDDAILLMPFIEGGISYAYITEFSQYKIDLGKKNQLNNFSKFGFHAGVGLSLFLMDVSAGYNYLYQYQFVYLDLRITIPVAATL